MLTKLREQHQILRRRHARHGEQHERSGCSPISNQIFDRKTSGMLAYLSPIFFQFTGTNRKCDSTRKREKCNQTRYSASKSAKFSLRYVQSSKNFLQGEVASHCDDHSTDWVVAQLAASGGALFSPTQLDRRSHTKRPRLPALCDTSHVHSCESGCPQELAQVCSCVELVVRARQTSAEFGA